MPDDGGAAGGVVTVCSFCNKDRTPMPVVARVEDGKYARGGVCICASCALIVVETIFARAEEANVKDQGAKK